MVLLLVTTLVTILVTALVTTLVTILVTDPDRASTYAVVLLTLMGMCVASSPPREHTRVTTPLTILVTSPVTILVTPTGLQRTQWYY